MPVSRLLKIVEKNGTLQVFLRWKGLIRDDDATNPLQRVYEKVPELVLKLLNCKSTPVCLSKRANSQLGLGRRECNDTTSVPFERAKIFRFFLAVFLKRSPVVNHHQRRGLPEPYVSQKHGSAFSGGTVVLLLPLASALVRFELPPPAAVRSSPCFTT